MLLGLILYFLHELFQTLLYWVYHLLRIAAVFFFQPFAFLWAAQLYGAVFLSVDDDWFLAADAFVQWQEGKRKRKILLFLLSGTYLDILSFVQSNGGKTR